MDGRRYSLMGTLFLCGLYVVSSAVRDVLNVWIMMVRVHYRFVRVLLFVGRYIRPMVWQNCLVHFVGGKFSGVFVVWSDVDRTHLLVSRCIVTASWVHPLRSKGVVGKIGRWGKGKLFAHGWGSNC